MRLSNADALIASANTGEMRLLNSNGGLMVLSNASSTETRFLHNTTTDWVFNSASTDRFRISGGTNRTTCTTAFYVNNLESHFGTATLPTTTAKGTITINGTSNGGERSCSLAIINDHISTDMAAI